MRLTGGLGCKWLERFRRNVENWRTGRSGGSARTSEEKKTLDLWGEWMHAQAAHSIIAENQGLLDGKPLTELTIFRRTGAEDVRRSVEVGPTTHHFRSRRGCLLQRSLNGDSGASTRAGCVCTRWSRLEWLSPTAADR